MPSVCEIAQQDISKAVAIDLTYNYGGRVT